VGAAELSKLKMEMLSTCTPVGNLRFKVCAKVPAFKEASNRLKISVPSDDCTTISAETMSPTLTFVTEIEDRIAPEDSDTASENTPTNLDWNSEGEIWRGKDNTTVIFSGFSMVWYSWHSLSRDAKHNWNTLQ